MFVAANFVHCLVLVGALGLIWHRAGSGPATRQCCLYTDGNLWPGSTPRQLTLRPSTGLNALHFEHCIFHFTFAFADSAAYITELCTTQDYTSLFSQGKERPRIQAGPHRVWWGGQREAATPKRLQSKAFRRLTERNLNENDPTTKIDKEKFEWKFCQNKAKPFFFWKIPRLHSGKSSFPR